MQWYSRHTCFTVFLWCFLWIEWIVLWNQSFNDLTCPHEGCHFSSNQVWKNLAWHTIRLNVFEYELPTWHCAACLWWILRWVTLQICCCCSRSMGTNSLIFVCCVAVYGLEPIKPSHAASRMFWCGCPLRTALLPSVVYFRSKSNVAFVTR